MASHAELEQIPPLFPSCRTTVKLSPETNRSVETGSKDSDWSGRRESNPRMQLGKLPFYH
jgi:hypothetical protein